MQLDVCHLDVKSSNVLIDDHGNVRLCDLGLASFCCGSKPVERELVTLWYRAVSIHVS